MKINEKQLTKIVKESIKRILKEDTGFKFKEGDKVIIHSKKGNFEGTIEDYDYNPVSYDKEYSVQTSIGKTYIGVPETVIELVSPSNDETYRNKQSFNKFIRNIDSDEEISEE